jgi:ElaB/YqjD/DUF883 family membrane-anchored ribosome-binding protein
MAPTANTPGSSTSPLAAGGSRDPSGSTPSRSDQGLSGSRSDTTGLGGASHSTSAIGSSPSSSGLSGSRPEGSMGMPGSSASGSDADDILDRVVQGAHQTIDRLAEGAKPAVHKLQEGVTSASDELHHRADQAREMGDQWAESLRSTVRDNPLAAIATAVAVGMLLAKLSSDRPSPRRFAPAAEAADLADEARCRQPPCRMARPPRCRRLSSAHAMSFAAVQCCWAPCTDEPPCMRCGHRRRFGCGPAG